MSRGRIRGTYLIRSNRLLFLEWRRLIGTLFEKARWSWRFIVRQEEGKRVLTGSRPMVVEEEEGTKHVSISCYLSSPTCQCSEKGGEEWVLGIVPKGRARDRIDVARV